MVGVGGWLVQFKLSQVYNSLRTTAVSENEIVANYHKSFTYLALQIELQIIWGILKRSHICVLKNVRICGYYPHIIRIYAHKNGQLHIRVRIIRMCEKCVDTLRCINLFNAKCRESFIHSEASEASSSIPFIWPRRFYADLTRLSTPDLSLTIVVE